MYSLYECSHCKSLFEDRQYREVEITTGHTVEHCGSPARWLCNLDPYEVKINNGRFEVWQMKAYVSTKLGTYETRVKALLSIRQWQARDKLQDTIDEFIDKTTAQYGEILTNDEIREMIVETSKS